MGQTSSTETKDTCMTDTPAGLQVEIDDNDCNSEVSDTNSSLRKGEYSVSLSAE